MDIVIEKEVAIEELNDFYKQLYQGDELELDNFVGKTRSVINSIIDGLMKGLIIISKNDDGDSYFKIKFARQYSFGSERDIKEIDMCEPKAKDLDSITLDNEKSNPFRTSHDIIKKCVALKYQPFIDTLRVSDTRFLEAVAIFLTGGLKRDIPS